MSSQVLARRWRPQTFSSLVGQDHIVCALTNALQRQRLHHAYLFTGTRGVGKTTLARILAKSLNCEKGITVEPCNVCSACTDIDAGNYIDYLELDAASNRGVEEMCNLLDQAAYAPVVARFKIYLIDEVHMLTNHAFNAMLKTLEEPPSYLKFILATTDPQKIPVTVLSRCLQFNLKQMSEANIVSHLEKVLLAEKIAADKPALQLIAKSANGSMRDALSLTDQAIAYSSEKIEVGLVRNMLGSIDDVLIIRLLNALDQNDGKAIIQVADDLSANNLSFQFALEEFARYIHRIAWLQFAPELELPNTANQAELIQFSKLFSADLLQLYYQIAIQSCHDLTLAPDEYSGFTMAFLRMLAFKPDFETDFKADFKANVESNKLALSQAHINETSLQSAKDTTLADAPYKNSSYSKDSLPNKNFPSNAYSATREPHIEVKDSYFSKDQNAPLKGLTTDLSIHIENKQTFEPTQNKLETIDFNRRTQTTRSDSVSDSNISNSNTSKLIKTDHSKNSAVNKPESLESSEISITQNLLKALRAINPPVTSLSQKNVKQALKVTQSNFRPPQYNIDDLIFEANAINMASQDNFDLVAAQFEKDTAQGITSKISIIKSEFNSFNISQKNDKEGLIKTHILSSTNEYANESENEKNLNLKPVAIDSAVQLQKNFSKSDGLIQHKASNENNQNEKISPQFAEGFGKNDWLDFVMSLPIRGLILQLAKQSELIQFVNNCIEILVPSASLATESAVEKLEEIISKQLKRKISLKVKIGEASHTAAQRQHDHLIKLQQQAEEFILADPIVKEIQQIFDALIEPQSIKPNQY